MTEIEVYDTEKQPDPATGQRPLKAKIRAGVRQTIISNETADFTAEDKTETATESEQTIDGGTLDEVTVTGRSPAPGFLERVKQGAAWATAIMILTAACWIIYKLKM